jgi:hypothetical protein
VLTVLRVVPGRAKSVYYALKHRDGVNDGIKDIYHVFGKYGFLVFLGADEPGNLSHMVEVIEDNSTLPMRRPHW